MEPINRRKFLGVSGLAGTAAGAEAGISPKAIDTHVHFYDPDRKQGVPWPPQNEKVLYRRVLPAELETIAKPLGVIGAVAVEASPWIEDNDWVLALAGEDSFVRGLVGHLNPGAADFGRLLERYRRNRRFRGIRCGNLWNENLGAESSDQRFIEGLRLLAQAGLELDTANPNPALVRDVLRLTDSVPNLRVVMDHFPIDAPAEAESARALEHDLRELAQRPRVYLKVSGVLRRIAGRVPDDAGYYKPSLDRIWELFGEDRLIYGSNWPVSNLLAPYATVLKVVRRYFAEKGTEASEKYFRRNALRAYNL